MEALRFLLNMQRGFSRRLDEFELRLHSHVEKELKSAVIALSRLT